MRWLLMITSFMIKRLSGANNSHPIKELVEEFKEFLRNNALKFFAAFVLIISLGSMLTSGIYLTLTTVANQLEKGQSPSLTYTIWAGFLLIFLAVFPMIIVWVGTKSKSYQSKKRKLEEQASAHLEESISLLINDFIRERELKRAMHAEREERFRAEMQFKADQLHTKAEPYEKH